MTGAEEVGPLAYPMMTWYFSMALKMAFVCFVPGDYGDYLDLLLYWSLEVGANDKSVAWAGNAPFAVRSCVFNGVVGLN